RGFPSARDGRGRAHAHRMPFTGVGLERLVAVAISQIESPRVRLHESSPDWTDEEMASPGARGAHHAGIEPGARGRARARSALSPVASAPHARRPDVDHAA